MSTGGRHAASDGSFERSAGGAAGRGAGLLVVAVVLGIALLHAFNKNPYQASSTGSGVARPARGVTTVPSPSAGATAAPTTSSVRPTNTIRVLPANGSGVTGAASRMHDKLINLGYNALAPTNASSANNATTKVEYASGFAGEARALATALGLPDSAAVPIGTPAPVANTLGADIVVIVGQDLAGTPSPTAGGGGGGGTSSTSSPPRTSPPATRTTPTTRHATPTTTIKH